MKNLLLIIFMLLMIAGYTSCRSRNAAEDAYYEVKNVYPEDSAKTTIINETDSHQHAVADTGWRDSLSRLAELDNALSETDSSIQMMNQNKTAKAEKNGVQAIDVIEDNSK